MKNEQEFRLMMAEITTDKNGMWLCTKYGVTMPVNNAAAFCARRFAAANSKDASGISFGHCRICIRGEREYKLAKRRGDDRPCNRSKTLPFARASFGRF